MRALIPDPWVLERGFYDVIIVDMEADLSLLWLQWPVTVVQSMIWLHSEVDSILAAAKKRYRHSRPGDCSYCGKWIKCDMHHHVSTFHLDMGSCGVAQCRGSPCGRARHRTVWTTSVGHTMCLRTSSRPVSTVSFRHGLSGVRFGPMP